MNDLVAGVLAGRIGAGARLIRWLEDEDPRGRDAFAAIHPHTGRAHLVGVTGAGGVGKSTLVDMLIAEQRRRGRRVGVVAVDPSSPYTGGAILGDRVRMGGTDGDRQAGRLRLVGRQLDAALEPEQFPQHQAASLLTTSLSMRPSTKRMMLVK